MSVVRKTYPQPLLGMEQLSLVLGKRSAGSSEPRLSLNEVISEIRLLIMSGQNPRRMYNLLVALVERWSPDEGRGEEFLFELFDELCKHDAYADSVEFLMKSDLNSSYKFTRIHSSACLWTSVKAGSVRTLKILLSHSDTQTCALPRDGNLLEFALLNRQADCFVVLMEDRRPGIFARPDANNSMCLLIAIEKLLLGAVALLLADTRPEAANARAGNNICIARAASSSERSLIMLLEDRRPGLYAEPNSNNSGCFLKAVERNFVRAVKMMLNDNRPERANPRVNNSACIVTAVRLRYDEMLVTLLKDHRPGIRAQPSAASNECLDIAIATSNSLAVKLLLADTGPDKVEPRALDSVCLQNAVSNLSIFNEDILAFLLLDDRPNFYAQPNALNSRCLDLAIKCNNVTAVRMLLQDTRPDAVDASVNDSQCLITACSMGHKETIVHLLLHDRRPGLFARPEARQSYCLWKAARSYNPTKVKFLLQDGRAQPLEATHHGDSVLDACVVEESARLLLSDRRVLGNSTERMYHSYQGDMRAGTFTSYRLDAPEVTIFAEAEIDEDDPVTMLTFHTSNVRFTTDDHEGRVIECLKNFVMRSGFKRPHFYASRFAIFAERRVDLATLSGRFPFIVEEHGQDEVRLIPQRDAFFAIEDALEEKDAEGRYIFYRDLTETTAVLADGSTRRRPKNIPLNKRLCFKSDAFILKAIRSRMMRRVDPGVRLYHGGSDRIKRNGKCCYFLSYNEEKARKFSRGEFHEYVTTGTADQMPVMYEWTWTMIAVAWGRIDEAHHAADDWTQVEEEAHRYLSKIDGFDGRWSDDSFEVMFVPRFYPILVEDMSKNTGFREPRPRIEFFDDAEETEDYDQRVVDDNAALV